MVRYSSRHILGYYFGAGSCSHSNPTTNEDTSVTGFQLRLLGQSSATQLYEYPSSDICGFPFLWCGIQRMEWHNHILCLLIALLSKTKEVLTYLENNLTNVHFFMHCKSTLTGNYVGFKYVGFCTKLAGHAKGTNGKRWKRQLQCSFTIHKKVAATSRPLENNNFTPGLDFSQLNHWSHCFTGNWGNFHETHGNYS